MASIHREITIEVPADTAWSALRDVGALHTRLAVGFVADCRLDGDTRIVTFANSIEARERIIDVDDTQRRIAWSASGGRLTHHNASAQVFAEGPTRCRFVWIADLLPDELAAAIAPMMEQGIQTIRKNFSGAR